MSKRLAGDRDRRCGMPSRSTKRDARLRVRVRRGQPDQERDHERVGDQHAEQRRRAPEDEQVLAQDQPTAGSHRSAPAASRASGTSATGPSKTTRPSSSAATRSATCSRSSRFCVTSTTRAAAVADAARRLPEPPPLARVERGGRLVEQQHLGSPSSEIARSSRWRFPTESVAAGRSSSGQLEPREQPRAALGSGSPSSRAKSSRFWRAREPAVVGGRCGIQPARTPSRRSTVPSLGSSAPGEDREQRRLAGAVRPDERERLARRTSRSVGSSATWSPKRGARPARGEERLAAHRAGRGGLGPTGGGTGATGGASLDLDLDRHRPALRSTARARPARRRTRRPRAPAASSGSATRIPASP